VILYRGVVEQSAVRPVIFTKYRSMFIHVLSWILTCDPSVLAGRFSLQFCMAVVHISAEMLEHFVS
jgi:hypothetical protein